MNLLSDGWSILILNKEAIIVFFITLLGLGRLGVEYLFNTKEQHVPMRFFTIISAGSLLLTWVSLLLALLGRLWLPILTIGSIVLPIACILYLLSVVISGNRVSNDKPNFFAATGFGLLFFMYFLARLAFLKYIILPPYDDSPDHFMIVRGLLTQPKSSQSIFQVISSVIENYYHIGFHSITAWLTSATKTDPAQAMSLLGQIFISISSLSILYLTLVMTENVPAGIVAAVFAAVAWKMPAFAVNWGKYPAVAGLALLPAWLGLLRISWKRPAGKSTAIVSSILIVFGLGLLHSRLLICLMIIGAVYYVGSRINLDRISPITQIVFGICVTLFVLLLFFKPIQIFYSDHSYLALVLLAVLIPFACYKYPFEMIRISLVMLGIWFVSQIPVLFSLYGTNWIDPPFVQILIYIPLSLMAGLGFSALSASLEHRPFIKILIWLVPATILVFGFVSLNLFYPDRCCNYVTSRDLKVIKWMDENIGVDSVVWTAGFKPRNYMIGTDAGVWIFALTGRNTNKLRYDFDWAAPAAREKICQSGYDEVNIYKGAGDFSFNEASLSKAGEIKLIYEEGDVKVYRIFCLTDP